MNINKYRFITREEETRRTKDIQKILIIKLFNKYYNKYFNKYFTKYTSTRKSQ